MLDQFPDEILVAISDFIKPNRDITFTQEGKNQLTLSSINRRFYSLFRKESVSHYLVNHLAHSRFVKANQLILAYPELAVTKLVHHVAFGQQEQAKEMLKINLDLAFQKAFVTDYSGRRFHISPFQLACWAYDKHMWKMMLTMFAGEGKVDVAESLYLFDLDDALSERLNKSKECYPKEYMFIIDTLTDETILQNISEQLKELQEHPERLSEHGSHYNIGPLLQAYKRFLGLNAQSVLDLESVRQCWTKHVAHQQRYVPAWIKQRFLSRTSDFKLTNTLFKEESFDRSEALYYDSWFPQSIKADYGFIRSSWKDWEFRQGDFEPWKFTRLGIFAYPLSSSFNWTYTPTQMEHIRQAVQIDYIALIRLSEVINDQFSDFSAVYNPETTLQKRC